MITVKIPKLLFIAAFAIVALSAIVFFVFPGYENSLAFSAETFFSGEYHRLFTFPFTHIGLAHLVENIVALLVITALAYLLEIRGKHFIATFVGASFAIALGESPFFPMLLIAGASVGIMSISGFLGAKGSNFIPRWLLIAILVSPLLLKDGLSLLQSKEHNFTANAEFLFHLSGFLTGTIFYFLFLLVKKDKPVLHGAPKIPAAPRRRFGIRKEKSILQ